jgi:hypothetical protein
MNYLLWHWHDDRPIESIVLREGKTARVGSRSAADLCIPHPYISPDHFEVRSHGDSVHARLLDPTATIWAMGEPVRRSEEVALRPGHLIEAGPRRSQTVVLQLEVAPVVDPTWLTAGDGCVPRLARAIYDELAFDRLPMLADALKDAGCTDAELLNHLRGPGPHVRGCWALDLLLEKQWVVTQPEWP